MLTDFFGMLLLIAFIGVLVLAALLIFTDAERKPIVGAIITTLLVGVGAAIGIDQTREPKTVEDLDPVKCAQYVRLHEQWTCVPWEQAE